MPNNHTNIKLRRGTAAEWEAANELLLLGEPGFEKDTYKLKIGDGVTLWNDLPYIAGGMGGGGGPLVYTYNTDFSSTGDPISQIVISNTSNGINFSEFFQELIDTNKTSSIRISSANDSNNFAIFNASIPKVSGSDFVFDVTQQVSNLVLTNDEQYYINIDIIGAVDPNANLKICSLELTGNPYYADEPVVVYQPDSTVANKVYDNIDTGLTLTRGSWSEGAGGLYNSESESEYDNNSPVGTEWNNDGWDDLSNITTRTYGTLWNVLNEAIGKNITNAKLVMHDTINDKYYKFDFTYWQPGGGQGAGPNYPIGGFRYVRTPLWVAQTPYTFTRAPNDEGTTDSIDVGLTIKRNNGNAGGIFNSEVETGWDVSKSPQGTLWNIEGWDDLSDVANREYVSFYAATGGQLGNNVVTRQYVMKDVLNNKYYKVQFNTWGGGNGSFEYVRERINGYCQGSLKFGDGSVQNTAFTETIVSGIASVVVDNAFNTNLIAGSGIGLDYNDPNLAISVTGLDSSYISDFDSAVSELIPVVDIVASTGIFISNVDGVYTIASTVAEGITIEEVQDNLGTSFLVAGEGTSLLYDDDPSNTLTISTISAPKIITNVFNKTGNPIPKFSVVYIDGGQGDQPTIALAQANTEASSSKTYGITSANIPNMSAGTVIIIGALTGLDTDQFNPTAPTGNVNGTTLWLSPTTPGAVTTTKPSAPNHAVAVGTIVRTHQNEGVVEVRIQNGYELEELHNVAISGVTDGQFLQYNSSTKLWFPSSSGNFTTFNLSGSGIVSGGLYFPHGVNNYSYIKPVGNNIDISAFDSINFKYGNTNVLTIDGDGPKTLVHTRLGVGIPVGGGIDDYYSLDVAGTGNFREGLLVNTVPVSVSGHTHTSLDITNFNSAVSGVLPTIANATDNRLLTSTGTSTGINAESNLTFNGTSLVVTGDASVDNLKLDGNTISSINSNGNISINPNGTGKVGVGTSSPSYKLDVLDNIDGGNYIRAYNPNTGSNANAGLIVGTNAGDNMGGLVVMGSNYIRPNETYIFNDGSGGIRLAAQSNAPVFIVTSNVERVRVTPTGDVGIGTATPSYKLDVDGGAQFNQIYPTVLSGSIVGGSVDSDISIGQIFNITLTENITLNDPTNPVDGVTVRWRIVQDSTGGWSVTLGSKFVIPSSASNPLPWSTTPNTMDILAATYHAGRDKWDIVAFVPGY